MFSYNAPITWNDVPFRHYWINNWCQNPKLFPFPDVKYFAHVTAGNRNAYTLNENRPRFAEIMARSSAAWLEFYRWIRKPFGPFVRWAGHITGTRPAYTKIEFVYVPSQGGYIGPTHCISGQDALIQFMWFFDWHTFWDGGIDLMRREKAKRSPNHRRVWYHTDNYIQYRRNRIWWHCPTETTWQSVNCRYESYEKPDKTDEPPGGACAVLVINVMKV